MTVRISSVRANPLAASHRFPSTMAAMRSPRRSRSASSRTAQWATLRSTISTQWSGSVVADLDTRFVEEIAATEDTLEAVQRDIVAEGLPAGDYDLVHARMVLVHLPTRRQVLETMAAALRPGGWLVIEDGDIFPMTLAE